MKQQRNTTTQENIKKVFAQLMNENGFNSITVSSIARKAHINRGTFYLHYTDKYDLLKQLENDIISDLTAILLYKDDQLSEDDPLSLIPYTAIYNAIVYIKNNFSFFEALVTGSGNSDFVDKFKEILEQLIASKIQNNHALTFSAKGLPKKYANEILLSSAMSIILLWVRSGALESPSEIADMILQAQKIAPYELLL